MPNAPLGAGVNDRDDARFLTKFDKEAEKYRKRYKSCFEMLESHSMLAKVRSITPYDIYALGKQLEMWEAYKEICEEDGTVSQLGRIPNIALDVLTVVYGSSPLSVIASTQPIEEERGTV